MMYTELFMVVGFALAAYSVIGNDSVQTLGTFMNSNSNVKWQYQWAAASLILIGTVVYSWYFNGGDITYGRLNKIEPVTVQWYHALAPALLLLLTKRGIPVSTSFLVLSVFASNFILEKMLIKSVLGYAVAAITAYMMWLWISNLIDEKHGEVKNIKFWRITQWCSTGFLFHTWLAHDMANIAVFMPRVMELDTLIMIILIFVLGLGYMFYERGGRIQDIVISKTGTSYVRSATIIDFIYAFILLFFKELNDIPMSTTFVFVGLLAGRELAIASVMHKQKIKHVFPLIGQDFLKMMIGLIASVSLVILIQSFVT